MKKIILILAASLALFSCQSTSEKKGSTKIHEATGLSAPSKIGDYKRILMNPYLEVSKSSSISYKTTINTFTVYFRDNDVTEDEYLDLSKQALAMFSKADKVVYEGDIQLTINDQEYTAKAYRGYDSSILKEGESITMGKIQSIVVFNYGDYVIKVRNDVFSLISADTDDAIHKQSTEVEQAILSSLLNTL